MNDEMPKPIIFLTFANDRDDRVRYLRNLSEEGRRLVKALSDATSKGLCELGSGRNPFDAATLEVLREE